MTDTEKILAFVSFCIEEYKTKSKQDGRDVAMFFERMGLTDYLMEHAEVLHSLSRDAILDDIDQFIARRQDQHDSPSHQPDGEPLSSASTPFPAEITQSNVRLLIPGKAAQVASLIAQKQGISPKEALLTFYRSETYQKLQQEATKYWHYSPAQLFFISDF